MQNTHNNNLSEHLWLSCHNFFKTIKQLAQDVGLKGSEMQTLMALAYFYENETSEGLALNRRPVAVGELVSKLELSHSATSQKISALEEHGFIERTFDKTDKRVICVALTEKGVKKIESTKQKINEILQKSLGEFGSENTHQFINLLGEFSTVINKNRHKEEN